MHSPVGFTTELKLFRMEPILPMSTLSRAAAEAAAIGGVICVAGCSVAFTGSLFEDTGLGASGTDSVGSTEEQTRGSVNRQRGFVCASDLCNDTDKSRCSTFVLV